MSYSETLQESFEFDALKNLCPCTKVLIASIVQLQLLARRGFHPPADEFCTILCFDVMGFFRHLFLLRWL